MKHSHWDALEAIFHRACALPASEQQAYLDDVCRGDRKLREELEQLLKASPSATDNLRQAVLDTFDQVAQRDDDDIGLQIGPYQLLRPLDGGGMGIVYLAVRSDDHYFQLVAIKLIRRGFESEAFINRFRHERQILANLCHPNIGAILDGGSTEDGRPYIVMEYVRGQPITLFSRLRKLATKQRIKLFLAVCAAVHHAHQKLVIHRDIKPENVLVTNEGTVKLLDFGISKLLVPELIPGQVEELPIFDKLMTPDYASPEQLRGEPLSTATDVYSLGVLLYELLTGSKPWIDGGKGVNGAKRISSQLVPVASQATGLSPSVKKELNGDLDAIIHAAMSSDPERRYQTVCHLADDLKRFLDKLPALARRMRTSRSKSGLPAPGKVLRWSAAVLCASVTAGAIWNSRQ